MNNKNRILFILAPKVDPVLPPLSVPCLVSYLKQRCWDTKVYDLNIKCYASRKEKYLNHWNSELQEFWNDSIILKEYFFKDAFTETQKMYDFIEVEKPAYIGFSIWSTNFIGSIILAHEIKIRWPNIKLIFGGPDVWLKLHMGQLNNKGYSFIDAFVIGEGESTLHELLNHYRNGDDIISCSGIAFFKNGKLHVSEHTSATVRCEDLPLPDFRGFELEKYKTNGKQIPLYFSRGCINRCIFCDERKLWQYYRTKTGLQLFNEFKQIKDGYPEVSSIYFSESLLNGNIKELRDFCHRIIDSGIKIKWEGNAIIRKEMDAHLLELMARAGCSLLIYGVESVSKRVLSFVGKVMSNGVNIEKVIRDTANAGIKVTINIMFGLPGETEEDAQENIDFIVRNRDYLHSIYPSWSFCYLAKLSDAYLNPSNWGLKPVNDVSFWESIDGSNTYPIRLERFERFCAKMMQEKILIQYPSAQLTDREKKLGYYYCFKGDYSTAVKYLSLAIDKEPWDTTLNNVLQDCKQKTNMKISVDTAFNHTDENWINGVARLWATAFFVENSLQAKKKFKAGRQVTFVNGDTRKIVEIKEQDNSIIIFLDGIPLDGAVVGYPYEFIIHSGKRYDKFIVQWSSKIRHLLRKLKKPSLTGK